MDKLKKLVLVVRSAQIGGVENHVYEILKGAKSFGYAPVLVSLADVVVAKKFMDLNIEIKVLKDKMAMSARSISIIYPLYKIFKEVAPDIIHLHGTRPIFIGSVAARLARFRKLILTVHGSYRLMAYNKGTGKIDRKLLAASKIMHTVGFLLAKYIVVDAFALISEVEGACKYFPVRKEAIRKKIHPIHLGVSPKNIGRCNDRNYIRKKVGLQEGLKVIGTVSRLDEPMKGISVLLRAVKKLFDDGYAFEVLIVGEGGSKQDLEILSKKLGISNRVHFLGYWKDLSEVYEILDIFVLPSFSEGFPIVNLEAMAHGIPVITTDVGGTREAVLNGTTGFVVPVGSVGRLADRLRFLMENETIRHQMGQRGKEILNGRFTRAKMLTRIFELYEACCDSR